MPTPLLTTKLLVPPVRENLVPRKRLLAMLDELARPGRVLGTIAAPAGYGKTTLVSAWLADRDNPVAWLSLESADADPARFLRYLIAAVRRARQGVGEAAESLLAAPRVEPEDVLTLLVNVLHLTDTGISVDEPLKYVTYYMVVFTIFGLNIAFGRRAFCHYGCWMAPFMILGRKVRNALNTPALRLSVQSSQCVHCHACDKACPMSLDVHDMVMAGSMESSECILCGSCVDACPKQVIHYSFSRERFELTEVA